MRLAFDAARHANAARGAGGKAAAAAGREGAPIQFIAVTRRRTERFSAAEFEAVLAQEGEVARDFYRRGIFRSLHSRGDVPGAVIGLEAADAAEAAAFLAELPLARLEMMDVQIVPLAPYRVFAAT